MLKKIKDISSNIIFGWLVVFIMVSYVLFSIEMIKDGDLLGIMSWLIITITSYLIGDGIKVETK